MGVDVIEFTIIGEPASKANSRQLVTVGKADARRTLFIKSKKARDYERDALLQIPYHAKQMLQGELRVTLHIFYASERPDLDESIMLDVLQAKIKTINGVRELVRSGVYVNDRQVREKHVYHAIDKRNPRCEIQVEQIAAELPLEVRPVERPKVSRPINDHVYVGDARDVPF